MSSLLRPACTLLALQGALCFSSMPHEEDVSSLPTSYKFLVNSCGDIAGPTMKSKIEAAGLTMNERPDDMMHYTKTWSYMTSLAPDAVFLLGDNVYNDGIQNWGSQGYGSPFGGSLVDSMADAGDDFLKVHGLLAQDGSAGTMFHSYLDILRDKLHDGMLANHAFQQLRSVVKNGVHVTWDDHDYLANDPSNPHFMRPEYRAVAVDALTGWDQQYMRYPPGSTIGGIERSWERTFNNHGQPFTVRFIILDEESTHYSTLGMNYVRDRTSETGWKPVRKSGPDVTTATLNADPAVVEDWGATARPFFGESQTEWFVNELQKPADLRLVFTGGPNFEYDYSYAALTDFPGAKKEFIDALRRSGAEKVVFFGGDSHATYVTKVPDILPYPLYTIIGSGQTQGLSYDRYVGYWGDISHRHLVAAGSNTKFDGTASFAEVELLFDPEPILRFTPHLADDARSGDVADADAYGRWGPWRKQTNPNTGEPWAAQYDIRLSELVNQANEAVDQGKYVTESIYIKYALPAGINTADVRVTLSITNAKGIEKSFQLIEGASWFLCGEGYFGLCKDIYGAMAYQVPRADDYVPSHVMRSICEHAGYVGDTISWTVNAVSLPGLATLDQVSGTHKLAIRNNALLVPAEDSPNCSPLGATSGYGCVNYTSTHVAYGNVIGPTVGVSVADIIKEPPLYGGYKVPVKGFTFTGMEESPWGSFDNASVQALWEGFLAGTTSKTELTNAYLDIYYPNAP